jgi:pimeloyl-ACP methyl ester carboxylesterase/DNA-binding winged helix-turn-helix (wHTH) protein
LSKRVYVFGRFRLDGEKRVLFSAEEVVTLTPKAFDTLLVLVENSGKVLSKEELMRAVWPDSFVEENNLAQNISALRKVLGESDGAAKFITTIPKRGYRFAPEVEVTGDATAARPGEGESAPARSHAAGGADGGAARTAPGGVQAAAFLAREPSAVFIPKTHYAVSTGDVNIAYQVVGEGPLDLVFVMGWVSHLEYLWREPSSARFLARLASFSRLILFDKRGTGLSDRVPLSELPTLEQRMTDVHAVMDAVGSKRAALLGVSEGGPMCALFAATYPERTSALIMLGTYAKRIKSDDYPWAPTEGEREEFLAEVKRDWGGPVGLEERAPSVADDAAFREWWAAYLRMGASPAAALALTRMNAAIDVRGVLPSVRVPTLVLHRSEDACLPVEGGRYVASRIPGAKYVEMEGRDHLPFVGDQDAIVEEIEEFLTGARHESQADSVLTTVLFALFVEEDTDATPERRRETREMRETYARHELTVFRGTEIELTGERLFATFDGPARAIRCALALAEALARLGSRARFGLHTGECDVRGRSVGGVAVGVGEAVAALAAPGETLISHTVKDLVAGAGIEFRPRGARVFDGIPGEWRLFAAGRATAQ